MKDGNILTLTLKDFQIFRNQTLHFGPSLNLIAAPNGSGKSSIANALALVFGGTPRTVGRTRELGDFIRFGAVEAVVEVEIVLGSGRMCLRRVIRDSRNRGQCFFIDGRGVLQREYNSAVAALGIDVESLCAFLPQERVAEFCSMNASCLLTETLRGTGIALDDFYELKSRLSEIDGKIATNSKKKGLVEATLARLEADVAEHRVRVSLVSRLRRLRYKRSRIIHDIAVREYVGSKGRVRQIETACGLQEGVLQEAIMKQNELESAAIKVQFDESVSVVYGQNREIKETCDRIKELTNTLELLRVDHSGIVKRRQEREEEKCSTETSIQRIKNDIKVKEDQFNDLFEEMKRRITSHYKNDGGKSEKVNSCKTVDDLFSMIPKVSDEELQRVTNETRQARYRAKELAAEIESLEEKKTNHSEQGHQRMEMLKRYHKDTHTAVLWLRQNKHLFQDEVLEPVFIHIAIHSDYASEIEALLGFQALSSFLVKNQRDLVKLSKILKDEQKLSINITEVMNREPQAFDGAVLKQLGIDGVAIDFVTVRKEYINMLCAFANLDRVPVSKRPVDEGMVISRLRGVQRMVTDGHVVEIRRSKYNSDTAVSSTRIMSRGVFKADVFDVDAANLRLEELSRRREENRVVLERLTVAASEISQRIASLKDSFDLSHLRRAACAVNEAVSQRQRLEGIHFRACSSITECDERIVHCDSESDKLYEMVGTTTDSLEKLLNFDKLPVIDIDAVMAHECDLENAVRTRLVAEAKLNNENANLENEKAVLAKHRSAVEETKSTVRSIEKEMDSHNIEVADLPDDIADIEDDIHKLEVKLSITSEQRGIEDEALDKENARKAIDASLTDLNGRRADLIDQIEAEKQRLMKRIYEFITPINTEFSRMFGRLGFDGRIRLSVEGEGSWELHIMVRFREGEELARLDSTRQSGGEKSMATALFLLALQQIAMAPFRLVDEINQGMDEFNERAVFEILRDISSASQFFIITPKLVDGLLFSDDTNAIILYGGPDITGDLECYAERVLQSQS
eukprot:Pompholyxophrys_punicea_v1_NODE_1_length_14747_cov_12.267901.p1 type:complete len:1029 gc:universal NODE_1_length_14747_cov_12.267901:6360-9446(+)